MVVNVGLPPSTDDILGMSLGLISNIFSMSVGFILT